MADVTIADLNPSPGALLTNLFETLTAGGTPYKVALSQMLSFAALISNNLSDLSNATTALNNLGLTNNFQLAGSSGVQTVTLTNPLPQIIICTPSAGTQTLKFSAMNVTTPGSKSPALGFIARVYNSASDGSLVSLVYQDGTTPIGVTLRQGQWVDLILTSKATANGTMTPEKTLTGAIVDASDVTSTTRLAGVLIPSSALNGRLARYVTDGSGSLTWDTLTNGQLYIGNTDNAPSVATLTAGSGISITNAAGSITINSSGGGIAWVSVSGTSQSMAINTGYVCSNGSQTSLLLPATASVGDTVTVMNIGAGGIKITQGSGQTIHNTTGNTTTGATGNLTSSTQYGSLTLVCTTTNTDWTILSPNGINMTLN